MDIARVKGAEAVGTLATLLRGEDDRWPLFLLGAGASFRSGVPTASEAVKQIARIVYSEQKLLGSRPPERVKPSEWEPWLREHRWFNKESSSLAENFPNAVEHLLVPAELRRRILLEIMNPANGISAGYGILADLVMRGLVRTILTTNFDPCLPDSLRARHPHIKHIAEVNRGPSDFDEFDVFSKCQIVWLHGKAEQYSDKNSQGETGSLDEQLLQLLRPLLKASPIVVMGYRGAEASIMEGLFGQSDAGRLDFRNGVYWCVRPNDTPHPKVVALAERLGSNFKFLEIEGFDEALIEVAKQLVGRDRFTGTHSGSPNTAARASFDERVAAGATFDDLDLDLALSTLTTYCEQLGRAPLTRDALPHLLQEQGLVITDNAGSTEITNGAVLLFGKDPQAFLPQSVVSVTEGGKKREIYDGNLISQHRRLLEKLESEDVNPVLKLKKRRTHDDQPAYHNRALVELLVNLLVHRDYELERSSNIDVQPGFQITFQNPGGLTATMAKLVSVDQDGRIGISAQLTDPRNISLCDIFFGLKAMERAGTGLVDVAKLMVESGGESQFFHNQQEETFTAIVKQAPSSAGSRLVAHSTHPTGIYVLNLLPFTALPSFVSVIKLTTRFRNRPESVKWEDCGVFVERSYEDHTELWSFAPLDRMLRVLSPIADPEQSRSISRLEIEQNEDERRVLSWLLRQHFEAYVDSFEDDGLCLEGNKSHRAYFVGQDANNRLIVWDSPQKRGNRREVVKRRSEERPWFENEGFGYDLVYMTGKWCVRIKPFYMFTGVDARTPLPAFARTSKATRRMKWDKNKNVETDLVFWATFLARNGSTMNLSSLSGYDLLVDCAYLNLEVSEPK
jgi:hypothetical protein